MDGFIENLRSVGRIGTIAAFFVILSALTAHAALAAEASRPDISGVWMAFGAQPPGGLGPEQPELSHGGEAMVSAFEENYGTDAPEPGDYCVPMGMPTVMVSLAGYPIEIIQEPDRVTMLAELEMQVRRIFLDGRGHPENYPHTRVGHSIGHWEGDTLVVDTALLKAWRTRMWPHSADARITERVYLKKLADIDVEPSSFITLEPIGEDALVVELTIDDPKVYEKKETVTIYYQRIPDEATLEYDCPIALWRDALEAHRHEHGHDGGHSHEGDGGD